MPELRAKTEDPPKKRGRPHGSKNKRKSQQDDLRDDKPVVYPSQRKRQSRAFLAEQLGVAKPTLYNWQEALADAMPDFREDLELGMVIDRKGRVVKFPPVTAYMRFCFSQLAKIRGRMTDKQRSLMVIDTIESNKSLFEKENFNKTITISAAKADK